MIRSDRHWKGIILSCLCILPQFYAVTDGRRYDKCTTQDGREGVCVVKRYCREASTQHLLPCESDEENHCCPIPTTHRSAAAPRPWEEGRPNERDRRPGITREPPVVDDRRPGITREPPVIDDRRPAVLAEPKKEVRRPVVFRDPDIEEQRSGVHRGPDRDDRIRNSNKDDRRSELPKGPDRDDRIRESSKGDRRPEFPLGSDREEKRSEIHRGYDRNDRIPSKDDRRIDIPKEFDWNDRHTGVIRDSDRDDRLNKTPPPADRRSPTRPNNDRPRKPLDIDRVEDVDEGRRRRPQPSQGYPKEDLPADRHRDTDTYTRPPSSRPAGLDPPVRRPDSDRFYPSRDELDLHRNQEPPRRPKPDRRLDKNESDSSKAPISFPDPYELSVPRPRVPACGVKPYELFIAGGTESDAHEWPWMTAIFRRHPDSRPKTFLCGGSLINTKYVLTAAHCFVNNYVVLPASSFVVRLGSHFLNSGEEYTVANLVIHHNHSGSDFFNDIALVRLASEVYITDKIAPICLPPYPDMMQENLVGRMATVAGWGDTSFRSSGTRTLQHVTVPVVSGDECFAAYSRVRGAAFLARGSDHVICAGLREGGKDACLGDSGGPLMLKMSDDRWVVVGIVSLGYKCAEPGYPGVYTRVTHYMPWIRTNMKRH